ncbi:GNAT family N-acetyltransferase [Dactylosporangium darangshiense]|uniref:GNAT family N-acetyltransferase n=1 Tax=Dactylosporangium darangshiense TaxID=579108 RepID=UPI0036339A40
MHQHQLAARLPIRGTVEPIERDAAVHPSEIDPAPLVRHLRYQQRLAVSTVDPEEVAAVRVSGNRHQRHHRRQTRLDRPISHRSPSPRNVLDRRETQTTDGARLGKRPHAPHSRVNPDRPGILTELDRTRISRPRTTGTLQRRPRRHRDMNPRIRPLLRQHRFAALDAAMDRHHPVGWPHDYLAHLAVTPARQRHGIGTALLQHRLSRLDTVGRTAYLQATGARNRDLCGQRDPGDRRRAAVSRGVFRQCPGDAQCLLHRGEVEQCGRKDAAGAWPRQRRHRRRRQVRRARGRQWARCVRR